MNCRCISPFWLASASTHFCKLFIVSCDVFVLLGVTLNPLSGQILCYNCIPMIVVRFSLFTADFVFGRAQVAKLFRSRCVVCSATSSRSSRYFGPPADIAIRVLGKCVDMSCFSIEPLEGRGSERCCSEWSVVHGARRWPTQIELNGINAQKQRTIWNLQCLGRNETRATNNATRGDNTYFCLCFCSCWAARQWNDDPHQWMYRGTLRQWITTTRPVQKRRSRLARYEKDCSKQKQYRIQKEKKFKHLASHSVLCGDTFT